jgi:uncharacterized membrane protein YjgN (DUF898 family)
MTRVLISLQALNIIYGIIRFSFAAYVVLCYRLAFVSAWMSMAPVP